MAKRGNRSRGGRKKKRYTTDPGVPKEEREDRIEMEGEVLEALPGTLFKVATTHGCEVLATLAGKLRRFRIRILPGDRVKVEVSPYDLSRGRITWRHRK